jgi:hypothetical protein
MFYVTIKLNSRVIQNKVGMRGNETEYFKIAEEFRKEIAEENNLKSCVFAWGVFDKRDSLKPILQSTNWQ